MNEIKNESHYFLKGAVYGLVSMAILWLTLGSMMFLIFGNMERVTLITSVGILIWGITWSIAGTIIGNIGLKTSRWKLVGAICGITTGVLLTILSINWPRCDYGNVIYKVMWAIPIAIELPSVSLLMLSDALLKKTFGITLYQGELFVTGVLIILSAISWGIFGTMLGKLIGKQSKIGLR